MDILRYFGITSTIKCKNSVEHNFEKLIVPPQYSQTVKNSELLNLNFGILLQCKSLKRYLHCHLLNIQ